MAGKFGIAGVSALATFLGASVLVAPVGYAQGAGPFGDFLGSWSGNGTIAMNSGAQERIRCRVTYSVDPTGRTLHQALRCASDSYNFNVSSDVVYSGGAITGTWTETTRQATGAVNGRAQPGSIVATVAGIGFTANLSLSAHGNQQSVTIRPQGATDVRDVNVTFRKG